MKDLLGVEENAKKLQGKKHLPELQAFRGLAATLVLVHHCTFYYANSHLLRGLSEIVLNAHAAVVSFYVLSGYVLSRSFSAAVGSRSVLQFYVRRAFRIYPALWLALCVAALCTATLHRLPQPAIVSNWWSPTFRAQTPPFHVLLRLFAGFGEELPVPVWSITVELFGSLLIPLIVWSMRRSRAAFAVLTLALLVLAFSPVSRHFIYFVYLVDFPLGASILLMEGPAQKLLGTKRRAQIVAVGSLLLLIFGRRFGHWTFENAYHGRSPATIEALAAVVLIGVIVYRRDLVPFLRWPALVWIGDISYSSYLFHVIVLASMAALAGEVLHIGLFQTPNAATLGLILLTLVVNTPLAASIYRFVEVPGITLSKYVGGLLSAKPEAPQAAFR